MHAVEELDVRALVVAPVPVARVARETDQGVEERGAALFEHRGLADADEAAAALDVVLKVGLLGGRAARRPTS